MSSEDDADDRLPNLPFSNAESLSNLLDGELSSSDNESDNQVDRVMEANDEPEKSNDKDSLTLGIIVKKWNKTFEVKDGEPFTKSMGPIEIEALHNPVGFFPRAV